MDQAPIKGLKTRLWQCQLTTDRLEIEFPLVNEAIEVQIKILDVKEACLTLNNQQMLV